MSGGAALPVPVLEKFIEVFGSNVHEAYGLTEISPVATFNQLGLPKAGTVGRPIWGVEVDIGKAEIDERIEMLTEPGEIGEVVVRGHNVFKGYLNKPDATAAEIIDGWFRTGDLGTRDADDYVSIVDRKKDLVVRGGYNVYPREVEETLSSHPAVGQVAVIGVPDAHYGEDVAAVVVKNPAGGEVSEEQLSAWAKERLAAHKHPRQVFFTDALPVGPSDKVPQARTRRAVRPRRVNAAFSAVTADRRPGRPVARARTSTTLLSPRDACRGRDSSVMRRLSACVRPQGRRCGVMDALRCRGGRRWRPVI